VLHLFAGNAKVSYFPHFVEEGKGKSFSAGLVSGTAPEEKSPWVPRFTKFIKRM
jgi:hypothetical protein